MCRIATIQMITTVLLYIKGFVSMVIFLMGSTFTSDINLHEAFTTEFKGYGGSVMVLGVLSWITVMLQRWATDRHNRFILMLCFFLDSIVLGAQYNMGQTVTSYTYPDFPSDMQLDCLKTFPQLYSQSECKAYFDSDRVAGMRLYWEYYYADRLSRSSFQKITEIEGDLCCGFFAPLGCVPNANPFPSNRDTSGIVQSLSVSGVSYALIDQRTLCGPVTSYYPQTDECLDYSDLNTVPPTVGGCLYDMGLGYCLEKELGPKSMGCASFVEDTVVASISGTGFALTFLTLFNVFAMLLECCMWWKRKDTDVLPPLGLKGVRLVDYNKVPDQFEVKPQYEVLAKKKFLPMPRALKMELARLAEEEAKIAAERLADEEAIGDEIK